ncbi:Ig-like domain-containing protein [Methanobrevibacter sp.]|uniref:Ig-like domain-containing protein n=1 Tax=Methanobrevibacter sp. TaxID=66852 RepID=UPI003867BC64
MDNKNIIIILIVIIVILAAALGVMFFQSTNAKEPTKIKITSDKEQYEGGKLSIRLTDLNKTPLSKEIVNITITNSKGKVVIDDVVKTDSKGKATLNLDLKKGKYNVTVSYGGNENYTGNNTTQKLTIKEKVVEAEPTVSSTASNGGNNLEGPETDDLGITREQAEHAMEVSGRDVRYNAESGLYEMYDPNRGIYHT